MIMYFVNIWAWPIVHVSLDIFVSYRVVYCGVVCIKTSTIEQRSPPVSVKHTFNF